MKLRILMVFLAFLTGMLASSLVLTSGVSTSTFATPFYNDGHELKQPILETPGNRIAEKQIKVFKNQVILDIENAEWSTFTPTKSMLPFLDKGANAIQVKPQSDCEDVEVGDIISYDSKYAEGVIIHRVIAKSDDSKGTFFIAKGDSNPTADPGKIRCDQILRVLVAIIY